MRLKSALPLSAAILGGFALCGWRGLVFSQPNTPSPVAADVISLRIQFGVKDAKPSSWDGSLAVTGGKALNLRDWRPRPGDKITGKTAWSLGTLQGPNFKWRPWEQEPETGAAPYLLIPGIVLDVKATSGTTIDFNTKHGNFSVKPFQVTAGNPLRLLGGNVIVDRIASAQTLSSADSESDFASMLGGSNGEVWAAWVAYKNQADQVLVRRFDGRSWASAVTVTEKPGDIFLAKMGRDGHGNVWVVWSEQVDGNWDLYGRRFDGKSWSHTERLTTDPQPDIYHNLTTDSNGNLWLVWQGFRSGKSDIFARRYDGSRWSEAERVSTSPANDWEPAIAADAQGRVYVAWDTYDKGNYDVVMREFAGGKWSAVIPVAATGKFEAHVNVACDSQNRLWATWNESGPEWGKDTGFLPKRQGTRLYQSRSVAVAVYSNGNWMEPAANFDASMPAELTGYNDLPQLQRDSAGRMWVFFRHRTLRIRDLPSGAPAHRAAWEIYGSAYQGNGWTVPVAVPFSEGRQDMRAGFASDGKGNLYAAWPADNRDYEEYLFQHAEVQAGRIPPLAGSNAVAKLKPREILQFTVTPEHTAEPEDLARIHKYVIETGGKTYRVYRGDTHRHTEFSMDGNNDGSLQETYRYAIDAAQLDYMGVTEHNGEGGPDVEYINWLTQQMADLFTLPGTFMPLYSYERSLNYPNGHRNVIFTKRGNPTLPIPATERKGQTGAKALYEYLHARNGIAISHTSATTMGTDWRDNDPEVEPLVEIYQGDRVSAEYEGAPKAAWGGDPASAAGGFKPAGYVWNAWAKGYKLGVQASSDHLSTHISYACTLAADGSREGLVDAMRQRHSYGATDNIVLDYRLQAGGKEYLQGDIVTVPRDFRLSVKISGTAPIRQIDIVRNNQFIHNRQNLGRDVSFTFIDNQPSSGESYYYVRVIQADGQMAWSSPIWVKVQ
jgi:hypothetical protein